jgi:hypothetical protein
MRYERPEIIQLNYGSMAGCATLGGIVAVFPVIVMAIAAIWNVTIYTNLVLTVTVGGVAFLAAAVEVMYTTTTMPPSPGE